MDEKKLIESCKNNDSRAQRQLYETFARKMMSVCLRYAGNRETAEDFLQEGFIRVFSSIQSYNYEGSFEGWMRRIFVNTALGYIRKQKTWQTTLSVDEVGGQLEADTISALERMEARELMRCIEALPDGYRVVLNLFAIEGYSHKEIAKMLAINEGTSRSQYARAKLYLQKLLKKQSGELSER